MASDTQARAAGGKRTALDVGTRLYARGVHLLVGVARSAEGRLVARANDAITRLELVETGVLTTARTAVGRADAWALHTLMWLQRRADHAAAPGGPAAPALSRVAGARGAGGRALG